jgi:hypothetical protein
MLGVRPPDFISVNDYLAGEEISDTKHEYLGGTVHAMAGATIRHNNIAVSANLLMDSGAWQGRHETRDVGAFVRTRWGAGWNFRVSGIVPPCCHQHAYWHI